MAEYTKVNLVEDVEDMAPGFGVEGIQARFARKNVVVKGSARFAVGDEFAVHREQGRRAQAGLVA